jgi:hypothetical protein
LEGSVKRQCPNEYIVNSSDNESIHAPADASRTTRTGRGGRLAGLRVPKKTPDPFVLILINFENGGESHEGEGVERGWVWNTCGKTKYSQGISQKMDQNLCDHGWSDPYFQIDFNLLDNMP